MYAEKYLNGKKWTDTNPTTVVEFIAPVELTQKLMSMQSKVSPYVVIYNIGKTIDQK